MSTWFDQTKVSCLLWFDQTKVSCLLGSIRQRFVNFFCLIKQRCVAYFGLNRQRFVAYLGLIRQRFVAYLVRSYKGFMPTWFDQTKVSCLLGLNRQRFVAYLGLIRQRCVAYLGLIRQRFVNFFCLIKQRFVAYFGLIRQRCFAYFGLIRQRFVAYLSKSDKPLKITKMDPLNYFCISIHKLNLKCFGGSISILNILFTFFLGGGGKGEGTLCTKTVKISFVLVPDCNSIVLKLPGSWSSSWIFQIKTFTKGKSFYMN